MKFKILFFSLLLSLNAQAASELIEKKQALSVVKNYANSIACNTSFQKDENGKILASTDDVYIIENGVKDYRTNELYVLWWGDQGCAGGSGTYSANLTAVLKSREDSPYIVTQDFPFGNEVDEHINYRFIIDFKQLSNNLFEITSGKYANDDSNAGPSLQDKILIKRKNNEWKVISSKVSNMKY